MSNWFGRVDKKQRRKQQGKSFNMRRSTLGIEQLEQRWVLSAIPLLTVVGDQASNEGAQLDLIDIGSFSDVVEGTTGGGSSIGLNPNDYLSSGAFDPAADVVIDTDLLTLDGIVIGTTVTNDVGYGSYQIAVFTFVSFELDAGVTLTATGSRPLAILSQSGLSVFGTIDVSATEIENDPNSFTNGFQVAGPGGGNGGLGNSVPTVANGAAAAGAPTNSAGDVVGTGGGVGGGHGGRGGQAEDGSGSLAGVQGVAFGDLSLGVQGGSGGATAGIATSGGILAGGGGGGGGIELGAIGQITIDVTGSVLANGGDAGNAGSKSGPGSGGGGAGGGILIHAASVAHDGLLSAIGGNSGDPSWVPQRNGGAGGGGEILVSYTATLTDLGGTYDVSGGTVQFGGSLGGEAGADGIVTTLQEAPPAVPVIESYDYSIDWGDGSLVENGTATIDTPGMNIGDIVLGSFDGSHAYADNGLFTVSVSVTGSEGGTDVQTFDVTVDNVAPELANVATDSSAIGGAVVGDTVTLTADFTDAGVDDTHTATIDWGDGTISAGVVDQVLGTVTGDHVYAGGGIYEATITLVDNDSGLAVETATALVAGVGANNGVLQVVGTSGSDTVKVFRDPSSGDYKVKIKLNDGLSSWQTFDNSSANRIEMILGDGDDTGFVSRNVLINAIIDAGNGDDMLSGGGGNDILLGGAGFDMLHGGNGRDLMIGGTGGDLIFGDGGQDILISGTTAFDSDRAALEAIMAEWTSARSYTERSDNLLGVIGDTWNDRENGEIFLIAEGELATVFDDEAVDWLNGGRGSDLYFGGDDDISLSRFFEIVEEIEAELPV